MVIGALSIDGVVMSTWPTLELMRSFEIPGLIFERFESFAGNMDYANIHDLYHYLLRALGMAQLFKRRFIHLYMA